MERRLGKGHNRLSGENGKESVVVTKLLDYDFVEWR